MNGDGALALLLPLIRAQRGPALWLLDEHGADAAVATPAAVPVISNRYDVAAALAATGWQTRFSDFDLSAVAPQSLDALFFRLAKEKALVHHVINEAARCLTPGGRLVLSGGKQQGIKRYAAHAAQRLGGTLQVKKMGNHYLATVERGGTPGAALDDRDYALLRPTVRDGDAVYFSKPGLYGWDKVDEGSAFLVQQLAAMVETAPQSVLDLGCGYGYLALNAFRRFAPALTVATDNNAAALLACRRNFEAFGVTGEVVTDDCGDALTQKFDLVVCNPPFHQGFGVERDMTDRFVAAACRLVAADGVAAFVTNSFIPIARVAAAHFRQVTVMADSGRYKLTRMRP